MTPRELKTADLSPLGAAIVRGCESKGMSLYEVNALLGWPDRRIYDLIRAGSVRASWVGEMAALLGIDPMVLIALDARGGTK